MVVLWLHSSRRRRAAIGFATLQWVIVVHCNTSWISVNISNSSRNWYHPSISFGSRANDNDVLWFFFMFVYSSLVSTTERRKKRYRRGFCVLNVLAHFSRHHHSWITSQSGRCGRRRHFLLFGVVRGGGADKKSTKIRRSYDGPVNNKRPPLHLNAVETDHRCIKNTFYKKNFIYLSETDVLPGTTPVASRHTADRGHCRSCLGLVISPCAS